MSVSEAVGAAGVLGIKASNDREVLDKVRSGLPGSSLAALGEKLGLSQRQFGKVLKIPSRTQTRRSSSRLQHDESDRLYRVARLYYFAADVLGSEDSGTRWLMKPNAVLGNVPPLQMLDTEIGSREVENTLGHIKYGNTFV